MKLEMMIAAGAKSWAISEAVLKNHVRQRVLGIDYGQKRIGLALSDEMRVTARPLSTLVRTNRQNDVRRLREICRTNGVGQIVVGHPLRMSGAAGEMAEQVARFAVRLQKELGIPVELLDERLTSWEAEKMVAQGGLSKREGSAVDDLAAAILLRQYLEQESEKPGKKVEKA
jgi:putative holliday junction resolvase